VAKVYGITDEKRVLWTGSTLRQASCDWLAVEINDDASGAMDARRTLRGVLQTSIGSDDSSLSESIALMEQRISGEGTDINNFDPDKLLRLFSEVHRPDRVWSDVINITAAAWVLQADICVYKDLDSENKLKMAAAVDVTDSTHTLCLLNKGNLGGPGNAGEHFAAFFPLFSRG
jgi:hypothetical protein